MKFVSGHWENRYYKFLNKFKDKYDDYKECHHIIPRSLGGSNLQNNLVNLSARSHYIAHIILSKGTQTPQMIKALHKMIYSTAGDVIRNYKITSKMYEYIRREHAKVVSDYSKNTVVAKHLVTEEIKRIPKKLFKKYNGILYEALAKGRKDSLITKHKKQKASQRPRKVKQGTRIRSLAASKYYYQTPKGVCQNSKDLLNLYPTFTRNTLTIIDNDVIISNKFASIHNEFIPYVGQTFSKYGIIKGIKCQKSK